MSLSLGLSGWQVSTLERPSGLAPRLAVSARNLSINLAWRLHSPSGWSLQVMEHQVVFMRGGLGGVAQEAESSVANQNLLMHH